MGLSAPNAASPFWAANFACSGPLPHLERTDTPTSLLPGSPHHHRSAPGRRATTPVPGDLESPHVRRQSAARTPAWLLPHRDPEVPPIQFRTTPALDPDISSELSETMPPPRADFSPRSAAPPRLAR